MVNFLSLINHQGRLFVNTPIPENDGLLAVIDFKQKNKPYFPIDVSFNSVGDSFLVSDSRGQTTLFNLTNNRYLVLNESQKNPITGVSFTGKYPQDQVMIVFKDKSVQTHSLNGKLLDKFTQVHTLEVKNLDINVKMNMILSLSQDACHLWSNNSSATQSIQKQRSIFAKDGLHFIQGKFTPDGQSVATLLKDGEIMQWSLDTVAQLDAQTCNLSFKSKQLSCFDIGFSFMAASGQDFSYLVIKELRSQNRAEAIYKLPPGCRGVNKMQLLRDKNLLAIISEGYFYILDLSQASEQEGRVFMKLNIRIPNESIKNFDVDFNMNTVILATSNGNAYLYDLPKALENERIIQKRKIDMGLEQDLVITYLQKATEDDLTEIRQNDKTQMRTMMLSDYSNKQPSFMNPLITQQQQTYEFKDYVVEQTMNTLNNPFVQKTLLDAQKQTIGAQSFDGQQIKNFNQSQVQSIQQSHLVSIQSQANPFQSMNEKQELMNAGLSSTLAKKSNFKKPSASIIQSTIRGPISQQVAVMSPQKQITRPQISVVQSDPQFQLDENFVPDFKFTQQKFTQSPMTQFNLPKLKQMLSSFGEYPEKYRFLTWKFLLELPLNKDTFQNLIRRGIHPAFKNLHKQYPIAQHRLYNKLVRTLSALGHWSPIFLDVDYLPSIVFPFIKIIPNDDLLVFEIIMALIVQYMQTWFECHPSEPVSVLTAINQVLENENPQLNAHLKQQGFNASIFAWPIMKNLFTEVLTKDDWLKLIDYLFTYKEDPERIIYFCIAFLLSSKGALFNIQSIEELHNFQQTPTGIPFKKIVTQAAKLYQRYSQTIFSGHISQNLPLIKDLNVSGGEYPVFSRYPEQVVLAQTRMRSQIIQEEEEILRKHALLEELKTKSEQILVNEELMRKQQETAYQAEIERKRKIQIEQELLLQERIRLDEMTRLTKLDHIKKLEEAVMKAMGRQEDLIKEEERVAEDELQQKQRLAQYEYQARLQDELINNMEFKANQRMLEMMQKNQSEEQIRKMKAEFDQRQREENHRDKVVQERWRLEDQEQKMKNELFRQAMQQQTQTMKQLAEKAKIDEKFRIQEHQKELQLLYIEEQRRLRALEEEQILKKQQMLEEIRLKGEILTQQDLDNKWATLNMERELEKEKARKRMDDIEIERQRLDLAIEREREEKERIDEYERRRIQEQEIQINRTILSSQSEQQNNQAELVKRQLQQDREEAERRRIEMMRKEAELREKDNLMQYIKQTGQNINSIVERGQRELEYKKQVRENSLVTNNSYDYRRPDQVNTSALPQEYSHLRHRESYENKIQERERQLKEQNDQLLKRMSEEKENHRTMNESQNPYVGNNMSHTGYSQNYGNPHAVTSNGFSDYKNYQQQTTTNVQNPYTQGHNLSPSDKSNESSLSNSHGDTDAIKKHYQIKQQVSEYHSKYNPAQQQPGQNQVFTYHPQHQQPPAQLRGHHMPPTIETSKKKHKKQRGAKQSSLSSQEKESYYHSSSSSNSSGEDEDAEDASNSSSNSEAMGSQSSSSQKQSAYFQGQNSLPTGSNGQQRSNHNIQRSEDYSSLSDSSSNMSYKDDLKYSQGPGSINPYAQTNQAYQYR